MVKSVLRVQYYNLFRNHHCVETFSLYLCKMRTTCRVLQAKVIVLFKYLILSTTMIKDVHLD